MSDAPARVPARHPRRPDRLLALLADEEKVVDPAAIAVPEAYERAFAAIEQDPWNEMPVLVEVGTGTVMGCPQATYVPGLGQGGAERVLIEAVRIRADRRGGGLGRRLMERAVARPRREAACSFSSPATRPARTRTASAPCWASPAAARASG
ncbi:GNAT family N-acetyltransferase [Streptomyces sp. NPDC050743]|uniref:GNAT family N-acetyltransferase n=1 Tax=Streptomyces sp. NPDC050743 TaxID=3365634 RepID=UPI0037A6BB28